MNMVLSKYSGNGYDEWGNNLVKIYIIKSEIIFDDIKFLYDHFWYSNQYGNNSGHIYITSDSSTCKRIGFKKLSEWMICQY